MLNQPEKETDRKHKVRVIAGNGLRADIWDEFTTPGLTATYGLTPAQLA